MTPAYAAFTERGLRLAEKLAASLPGSVTRCGHGGPALAQWTAAEFVRSDALVFVGAVGIAVRAIAPHCQSKASDPAVVVLDECGRFAVPILSGHLGGANDLARQLSALCGAVPVADQGRQWETAGRTDRFRLVGISPSRRGSCGGDSDPNAGRSRLRPDPFPCRKCAAPCPPHRRAGRRLQARHHHRTVGSRFCRVLRNPRPCPCLHLRRRQHRPETKRSGAAGVLPSAPVEGFLLFRRAAPSRARHLYALALCSKRYRRGQCVRAGGCAGGGPIRIPKQAGSGVTFALALRPYAPDWRWQHE